jgi:hypothetical protein
MPRISVDASTTVIDSCQCGAPFLWREDMVPDSSGFWTWCFACWGSWFRYAVKQGDPYLKALAKFQLTREGNIHD